MKILHPDICLSIGNMRYEDIFPYLKVAALAEIRLDLLNLTDEQIRGLFTAHGNLIATYRCNDSAKMFQTLTNTLDSGAAFVDVDCLTENSIRDAIVAKAKGLNRRVIISYHNFECTPNKDELERIIYSMKSQGADICKVACMANEPLDCSRVMALYEHIPDLVAFCMGDAGKITRLAAPILGAPFTYASVAGASTAPGQLDYLKMEEYLNYFLPFNHD